MFKIELTSWGLAQFSETYDRDYISRVTGTLNTVDQTIEFLLYMLRDVKTSGARKKIRGLYNLLVFGFIKEGVISL